jgi:4-hydroxy-tetrahydrodipicolinate reductase
MTITSNKSSNKSTNNTLNTASKNTLNVAVIGDGRTGQEVVHLLQADAPAINLCLVFNEDNPVTVEGLANTDVAIVFVPPTAMDAVAPVLVEAQVDVVCGTTGYEWPQQLLANLQQNGARWVLANNFSLGMNLVRRCLQILGQSSLLYGQPEFHINKIHHTNKLDAPSGTAVSWQNWLDRDCEITSVREGDVNGIHSLMLETEFEQIELRHEAKDRALFAQGAVWAATNLDQSNLTASINEFSTLVDAHLAQSLLKPAAQPEAQEAQKAGA